MKFEAVGLDQKNFSIVEHATSKQLREKYSHLQALLNAESKDGRYVIQLLIVIYCLPEFELEEVSQGNPENPLQMKQCLDRQCMEKKVKQIRATSQELRVRIMNSCTV